MKSLNYNLLILGLQLYLDQKTPVLEEDPVLVNNRKNKHASTGPASGPAEMGLKQFSTITDLLLKLKDDLTLSFPSFIREFIGEFVNIPESTLGNYSKS